MRISKIFAWILTVTMIIGMIPVMTDRMSLVEASSSDQSYNVRIWGIKEGHMSIVSGSDNETVDKGNAINEITIMAASDYYFPETYMSDMREDKGIVISRNEPDGIRTSITISGTPTESAEIYLEEATPKAKQDPPESVVGGELKLENTTRNMLYADSSNPSVWHECGDGTTNTTEGDKYIKYAATYDKLESEYVIRKVMPKEEEPEEPSKTYAIRIINPHNSNMLVDAAYDNEYQPSVSGKMDDVYYVANPGYEFPANYYVESEHGVKVERVNNKVIRVTGTPTDDVDEITITLIPASAIIITYHTVTITNGSGSGRYASGDTVTIKADAKTGMSFSRWNIKKGGIALANSHSSTTTFVMKNADVEIEAYYTEGTSAGTGTNESVNNNTTYNNNNTTTDTITAISKETYTNNSELLNISSRVSWSGGGWKVTWSAVSGATGYDVFAGQGKKSLKTSSVASNLSGNGKTKTTIKTIKGKKVNKKKTYEFQIKAYRVVNRSKEYIGTSRILYVAGSKNKTYTNIKQLSPVNRSLSVGIGKTAKIGTYVKKEKSSKKLVTGRNGRKLQYFSSNRSIATVSSSGTVKGISKGSCTVYVIAWNGKRTSVNVTVQ